MSRTSNEERFAESPPYREKRQPCDGEGFPKTAQQRAAAHADDERAFRELWPPLPELKPITSRVAKLDPQAWERRSA